MKRHFLVYATTVMLALSTLTSLNAQENDYTGSCECSCGYDCDCGEYCDCEEEKKCFQVLRNNLYFGPDIYHVKRLRHGGSQQSGVLYGFRTGYDRIKRYNFYVGIEGAWASGDLSGSSSSGTLLKSTLTDAEVEGRFGYTIGTKHACRATLTPFVGAGYFCQTNKFHAPTPITLHFKESFKYAVVGFISNIYVRPCLSVGLNFKAKFVYDPESHISNDPDFDDVNIHFGEKTQYEVDLPITYYFDLCNQCLTVSAVPFYIYRHYGALAGFPFDFLETKYINYGGRLLLGIQF